MEFEIQQFIPSRPTIFVDGMELEISLITLRIEAWAIENYGGMPSLYKMIQDDPSLLVPTIWHLLINKEVFSYSIDKFTSTMYSLMADHEKISAQLVAAFYQSIERSKIQIKNPKRFQEAMEIKNAGKKTKVCYATYFDSISKRVNISWNEFQELTLGQLHALLFTAQNEAYKDLEVQAALNGKKLKERVEYDHYTEEEEAQNDQDAKDLLLRMQKEYEARENKK